MNDEIEHISEMKTTKGSQNNKKKTKKKQFIATKTPGENAETRKKRIVRL